MKNINFQRLKLKKMATNINGKKKQIVLMIAKKFLAYHTKKGLPTDFEMKIKSKDKVHAIRANYELWKKKINEVKSGKAELVLKQWSGLPYRTKQEKIFIYDKDDEIGVSKLTFSEKDGFKINDEVFVPAEILAKNDGLSIEDFQDWFKVFPTEPMAIIHLSGFRYTADKFDLI